MLSKASLHVLFFLAYAAFTVEGTQVHSDELSSPHTASEREKGLLGVETNDLPAIAHDDQVVFSSVSPLEASSGPVLTEAARSRHVPLPVDNPTKSFWIDTPDANPLAEEGSTGELTKNADVCVIGSGITGISAAWHLSKLLGDSNRNESKNDDGQQRQKSVVVLESRRFCSGATGRNGGHLTPIIFQGFSALEARYNTTEALKSYAIEAHTYDAIVRFIKEKRLENEVDLVEGGHLTLLKSEEEEKAARRDWKRVKNAGGITSEDQVEWIDNETLSKIYHVHPKLGYSAVHQRAHNLWPCKVVTQLFKDAQSSSQPSNLTNNNRDSGVSIALHTKTPVTSITKLAKSSASSSSHKEFQRRWSLHTPRGTVDCAYVLHATNGYAAHLLPFLSGIEEDVNRLAEYGLDWKHRYLSSSTSDNEKPRGAYGIKPTRGQVGGVRASVNASSLGWLASWGNGGDEYWFPRYQDTNIEGKNPLIILGGGRYAAEAHTNEVGVWNDSTLNPRVSSAIRAYLPAIYPEQFAKDGEWEMEWSGIMGFTKSGDPFVGPLRNVQSRTHDADSEESYYEGQYISAGYSGHGMPRAYACAEAVAGMIAAQIQGKDWKAPGWLPERYLTWATTP